MRIGFDCAKLVKGTSKSIGIYNITKSVVTRLARQLSREHELVVIGNENNREDFDVDGVEFHSVELDINSTKAILLWETVRVNSYIKKLKLDEVVFPRGFTSLFCPVKDVIIVHDLIPFYYAKHSGKMLSIVKRDEVIIVHDLIPFYYAKHFPGVLNRVQNAYVMLRMKSSIKTADKVITISEYSKQDILKIVPKAEKKTYVILHGYEAHNMETEELSNVPEKYFYGITSRLPHKNAAGLIKAYAKYYEMTDKPYDLEVAGLPDLSMFENNPEITLTDEVKKHIHCNKFMDDRRFYSLFAHSKGLVFLSLIEGFGLPPLEAMELGVPVISSNATSLPEVVRDAGIMADPENTDEIAAQMKQLTEQPELAKELISKGYANLKNFNWEERVEQYIKVLTAN